MTALVEPEVASTSTGTLAAGPEALAAIVAAVSGVIAAQQAASGSRGGARTPGWSTGSSPPWRFSGRSWAGPAHFQRDRPRR